LKFGHLVWFPHSHVRLSLIFGHNFVKHITCLFHFISCRVWIPIWFSRLCSKPFIHRSVQINQWIFALIFRNFRFKLFEWTGSLLIFVYCLIFMVHEFIQIIKELRILTAIRIHFINSLRFVFYDANELLLLSLFLLLLQFPICLQHCFISGFHVLFFNTWCFKYIF